MAKLVILAAGPPHQGDAVPPLLAGPHGMSVLGWILHSFEDVVDDVEIVTGYRHDDITEAFPRLHTTYNEAWESTTAMDSLALAYLPDDEVWVTYGDVLHRKEWVDDVPSDIMAVDPEWDRQSAKVPELVPLGGDTQDQKAQFTGLIRLSKEVVGHLREWLCQHPGSTTEDALLFLRRRLRPWTATGNWTEMYDPSQLSRFILGTKAQTLQRLEGRLSSAIILPQQTVTAAEWGQDQELTYRRLASTFSGTVVVRSSCLAEDGWSESNAGSFRSHLDVPVDDEDAVRAAIDDVFASYGAPQDSDHVLVQPMLQDVHQSGVITTRRLGSGAPYFTVNLDESGSTDRVTGGFSGPLETFVVHRDTDEKDVPGPVAAVIAVARELEQILHHDELDVEYAITKTGLHVLQVRPLVLPHRPADLDARVRSVLSEVRDWIDRGAFMSPPLPALPPIFGLMPDWNPAEIIGVHARRLSRDIYRFLIMDTVWAQQRAQAGYKDARPAPLLYEIASHPYVDVRASLYSFIPTPLDEGVARRLVDHGLARLREQPHLHDKLEFEVALTAWSFDLEKRRVEEFPEGFWAPGEWRAFEGALADVTNHIIARLPQDRLDAQEAARNVRECRSIDDPWLRVRATLWHARRGALAFAHAARQGFVAVLLLKSLIKIGVLSQDQVDRFVRSIRTVASDLEADGAAVAAGELEWHEFVDRYGHLRPGTYDVTTPRYDSDPERYLRPFTHVKPDPDPPEALDRQTLAEAIDGAMADSPLEADGQQIVAFMEAAIISREYTKFLFTRGLSDALEDMVVVAAEHGLARDDVADLPLSSFMDGAVDAGRNQLLSGMVPGQRDQHRVSQAIELPPLLWDPAQLQSFKVPALQPNFITDRQVTAEIRRPETESPEGGIALIESADPGFDWIFGAGCLGLVTCYGGANSHMAIRAAELGLPSVIGVGSETFERLERATELHIDCPGRRIQVVR